MKEIIRKCAGCKALKNRCKMIKITKKGAILFLNPNSKIHGRSVYVCNSEDCIKNLIKTRGIKRALKFNNDTEIKKIENLLISEK